MAEQEILEYRLAQAEGKIIQMGETMQGLEKRLQNLKEDEDRRERSQLLWGISALGAVVMTLGSVLWSYRGDIFR